MPTIDELYREVIENQKQFLYKLQDAFNAQCKNIRAKYKTELDAASDDEGKQMIMQAQKEELDKTLAELKGAVHASNKQTMEKLENLQAKREQETIGALEAELKDV